MGLSCLPLSPANGPNRDVAFKIPDNCDGCAKIMTETIPKFKGVASCVTDTKNQKIVVTGSFNEEKLLKKLKKVTCEDVEIVVKSEKKGDDIVPEEAAKAIEPNSDERKELEKFLMMYSDENPNAKCTIS
ncbi:PREDICTED: uncharacterized protein LOC109126396 [Camelina sativa]|uniref:Uncharacterized protein LOC109126396 n=1 Tax=Camelina sativa TaxID=90675 RepID=A0ABM1QFC9_CAMSA|nr:PREDICTED: uncharacterized protein LOC109126396 [Camelina sativa]